MAGVAFHASDSGSCDCWGDSVRWVALSLTMAQISSSTRAQLLSSCMAQLSLGLFHIRGATGSNS